MEVSLLVLLFIGLIAGILAGLLGIGGGLLFTPVLFYLFSKAGVAQPVVWSIGSALFCTFISALSSSIRQRLQYNFYFAEGLKVGLFGVAGTIVGKQLTVSSYYRELEFSIVFSLILLYAAWSFIRRSQKKGTSETTGNEPVIRVKDSVLVGGVGGFIASLAGIGGGTAMVPIMNLYHKLSFQKAVSISSLAIVFISLGGSLQLGLITPDSAGLTAYTIGFVDFGAALPLAFGGLLGGFAGAWINVLINRKYLQWAFAALAVSVAAQLLFEALS